MDLETENRIASILLKEAAELRRRAEREGVHSYLNKPDVRVRPNSRFLTATVLGVQQANRAVEINELWRAREKEQDLQRRLQTEWNDKNKSSRSRSAHMFERCSGKNKEPSSKLQSHREDVGLRDEEVEKFLHSKAKRGRGCVGPRMDGCAASKKPRRSPHYHPSSSSDEESQDICKKKKKHARHRH